MPTCDDLATKAELQELRDQLNAVLGEKEGGGTQQIFEKGLSPGAIGTVMVGTTFVATKNRAANAIMDIVLSNPADSSLWQGLKSGVQKLETVAGNGVKKTSQGLTKVGNLVGKGVSATATAAKGAGAAVKSAGILGDLTVLGASLAINISTLKVLDKRIEAEAKGAERQIDAVNYGMIKMFQKQQGNIDAVNAELDANNAAIQANKAETDLIKLDIIDIENTNIRIQNEINQLEADARTTKAEVQEVRQEIDAFEIEVEEITTQLKADIAKVETSVDKALMSIEAQKQLINVAFEEIEYIKLEIDSLDERIRGVESEIASLKAEFEALKEDLGYDPDLIDARSKLAEAKLIIMQNKEVRAGAGGSIGIAAGGTANTQNKLLDLMGRLSDTQTEFEELTAADVLNNPAAFNERYEQLLQGVQTGTVDAQQLQNLRTDLRTDFSNTLDTKLNAQAIPMLDTIALQTAPVAISTAVQSGVCQSLNNPTACPVTPGNPNPMHGLQGMNNGIQNAFNATLTAMGAQDLVQGQTILSVVRNTNEAVRHADYGLFKIQEFASKAWKATQADKVMGAITVAMTIHNAMMLSNNLGSTISEALNMALDALGIRDETDTPIDIGAAVRSKISAILTSLLGAEQYQALTTRIAKANRIYQASANLYNLAREIGDTTRSITEVACENTGKIGNALLRSGVVFEDAYQEMIDSVNPQSKAQLKLEKFRNGVEVLENASEAISSISSDVIELQELRTEIGEGKRELDTAREEFKAAMETEKLEIKEESKADTDVNKNDFGKDESEEN